MYTLIFAVITGLGIFLLYQGLEKRKHFFLWAGLFCIAGTMFLIWFLGFYGELLWFESLGYQDRFWKVFTVKLGLTAGMAAGSFAVVWLLTFKTFVHKKWSRWLPPVLASLLGAGWGLIHWEKCLRFFHRLQGSLADPVYGKSAGFYLFELPLLDAVYQLGLLLSGMGLVFVCLSLFVKIDGSSGNIQMVPEEKVDSASKKSFRLPVVSMKHLLKTTNPCFPMCGCGTGVHWILSINSSRKSGCITNFWMWILTDTPLTVNTGR